MNGILEEIEFAGRFTEKQWQHLCNVDARGFMQACATGKEEAEAFAQAVLGYLPPPAKRFGIVLPFAMHQTQAASA